jgi:hypothetical protein
MNVEAFVKCNAVVLAICLAAVTMSAVTAEAAGPTISSLLSKGYRITQMSVFACKKEDASHPCFFYLLGKDDDYYLCQPDGAVGSGQANCVSVE